MFNIGDKFLVKFYFTWDYFPMNSSDRILNWTENEFFFLGLTEAIAYISPCCYKAKTIP